MGIRPRKIITKVLIGEIVVDELSFTNNIGSKNARKVVEKSELVHIELWYDKHYVNRAQFGDNDGKRDGIEENTIQELVSNSLRHLIHFSFMVKNFSFVNSEIQNTRAIRLVLQKETNQGLLNVAVGFYHITKNKYEVTVFTAMVIDSFSLSDSQYTVLIDGDTSILSKMDNKCLKKVSFNS